MIKILGYILIVLGFIDIASSWFYKDLTYDYLGEYSQYSAYLIITIGSFYLWLDEKVNKERKFYEYVNLIKVATIVLPIFLFLYFLGNVNDSEFIGLDEQNNEEGVSEFSEGNYEQAIIFFNKAIELNPNEVIYYTNRARSKYYLNDLSGAKVDVNIAAELDNDNISSAKRDVENTSDIYVLRSEINLELELYKEALDDINFAINLKADAYNYFLRGVIYHEMDEFSSAVLEYNRAINIDPSDPDYYYYRGNSKTWLKDHNGAISDYDITININSEYSEAYLNRGYQKTWIEDLNGACLDFKLALSLGLTDAEEAVNEYCN